MPLNKSNTRFFYRTLYAGQLKTITLLRRNIDQQEGIVTAYKLFGCRRGSIHKTGEPIQNDMTAHHSCVWHIPRRELDRLKLTDINSLDRFVEVGHFNDNQQKRFWQPEATTPIDIRLFENMINVSCLRVDPPSH